MKDTGYAHRDRTSGTLVAGEGQLLNCLQQANSGFYYSGISIEQSGADIKIRDPDGNVLPDCQVLKVGVNDYRPAVCEAHFPVTGTAQALTAAGTIISYLAVFNHEVNYTGCNRFFRYK